jgi:hypothetical protein
MSDKIIEAIVGAALAAAGWFANQLWSARNARNEEKRRKDAGYSAMELIVRLIISEIVAQNNTALRFNPANDPDPFDRIFSHNEAPILISGNQILIGSYQFLKADILRPQAGVHRYTLITSNAFKIHFKEQYKRWAPYAEFP